ncbi:hypothetical protein BDP81DRAFT_409297 [Colletotrichum phormii]|uniref:Uncharacterized protein n=1 Tax=Colletotrichum phormii TaxID=359342 RepID=A0AAI9ZKW1_9PEZI|nr:uncharacterized protein BDP81DRAFT_409297 [Colletotrichum phormii]KAK1625420.1 hypothetical protein BDP81DRAFT_409297 [Colletotrichum phormii]
MTLILQSLASHGQSQNRDVPAPDSDAARNAAFHGFNPVILRFLERIAMKLEKPESAWTADKKAMVTMAIFSGITTALNYLRRPISRNACYKKVAKIIGCAEEVKLAKKAALEALEGQVDNLWKTADKGLAEIKGRVKHGELNLLDGKLDEEARTFTIRVDAMATAERVTGLERRVDAMAEAERVSDLERRVSELTATVNTIGADLNEQAIRGGVTIKALRSSIDALKEDYGKASSRIDELEENIQDTATDLDAHKAQFSHFM